MINVYLYIAYFQPGREMKHLAIDDKLITDENGIYTNGGAYSFLNLIIYLEEKYYDRQTAVFCSKVSQIELDRHSQSLFTIFSGQKMHGDET
jgi:hypothetical protein